LLDSREGLDVGDDVHLMLRAPGGELLGFRARVIHLSPTRSASLEIENPDGAPVDPADLAEPAAAAAPLAASPVAEHDATDADLDASSGPTAEYDVDVERLIGANDTTDPGTVVMEMDDDVESLLGTGDDELATVVHQAVTLPDDVPDEVEAAFSDGDATRVEEDEATRIEEGLAAPGDDAGLDDDAPRRAQPPAAEALETAAARLQAMNPVERRRYALVADRLERSLLMRDSVRQLQVFVLKNPRVDEQEILEYARLSTLTPEAISQITSNPRWIRPLRVRLALVKNAATPRAVSKRLLETLSIADLLLLAKTGEVKYETQQLARSVLERRGYTG